MKSTIDPKLVADLKAKHGDVFSITKCGMEILYRGPTAQELDRFLETAEKDKPQACVILVASCILHPSFEAFEVLRNKKPGILYGETGLVSCLQAAAGMAEREESVKL